MKIEPCENPRYMVVHTYKHTYIMHVASPPYGLPCPGLQSALAGGRDSPVAPCRRNAASAHSSRPSPAAFDCSERQQ